MKTVFISREVGAESTFRQMLEKAGMKVYGHSLIRFEPVLFDELPEADWIFFYSRKAVQFFFNGLEKARLQLPANVKLAAIGAGTATELPRAADFVGNGKPDEVAAAFLAKAMHKRVLFPHAEHSRKSVQQLLDDRITSIDLVVYRNEAKKDLNLPKAEVLVFTSPLNVQAYFLTRKQEAAQIVVAIGQTTRRALEVFGILNVEVAVLPTETHLAKAVLDRM